MTQILTLRPEMLQRELALPQTYLTSLTHGCPNRTTKGEIQLGGLIQNKADGELVELHNAVSSVGRWKRRRGRCP